MAKDIDRILEDMESVVIDDIQGRVDEAICALKGLRRMEKDIEKLLATIHDASLWVENNHERIGRLEEQIEELTGKPVPDE